MATRARKPIDVLVLQGGGALGSYQAGAYQALADAGHEPEWIAGISIGAINAALIAGNRPPDRLPRLTEFWNRITSALPDTFRPNVFFPRRIFSEVSATAALFAGAPGFFTPRRIAPAFMPDGTPEALSFYDTEPLVATLKELVDFDYLNREGPRLSLGAVELTSGNFDYFDSRSDAFLPPAADPSSPARRIGPQHVRASGALPPGFPPVEVEGKLYWDGGLVSNTPLQYVLDHADGRPLNVFQMDLFSARGPKPATIFDAAQREKDIRYSSRTRLTTDRYRDLAEIRAAACRLRDRLGETLGTDPDLDYLCHAGAASPVMLVHLIHRRQAFEGHSKDYEFSRLTMTEHWEAGRQDVARMLASPEWKHRGPLTHGITVLDAGREGGVRMSRAG